MLAYLSLVCTSATTTSIGQASATLATSDMSLDGQVDNSIIPIDVAVADDNNCDDALISSHVGWLYTNKWLQ